MIFVRFFAMAFPLFLQVATTGEAFACSVTKHRSSRPLCLFGDRTNHENEVRRKVEFKNLEPLEETEARRQRIDLDMKTKAQFEKFGDRLWDLRSEVETLSRRLIDAIEAGKDHIEISTREKLRDAESRDPELVYMLAVADLELADKEGRSVDAQVHKATASAARSCLPQFNLNGLWVGKYGSKYDLINITYVGDTLIAEKVTGEHNVPKGAITFKVDLHPLRPQMASSEALQPIMLTDKAAQKWGTRKLPRYAGLGQVAERNFENSQWLDGQLIIISDEYFSFAWLPIEQQIFFGRPSPELALKMLRDSGVACVPKGEFPVPPSFDADVAMQKEFATRCLELSHDHEDEIDGNGFGGIWHCIDDTDEFYFE